MVRNRIGSVATEMGLFIMIICLVALGPVQVTGKQTPRRGKSKYYEEGRKEEHEKTIQEEGDIQEKEIRGENGEMRGWSWREEEIVVVL